MEEEGVEAKSKESRLYRQGLSYRTMSDDNTVCHNSDIRYKTSDGKIHEECYKKKYIWCLVNKLSKVVTYCFEDDSRGQDALKHILGDSQVKALQSDGYNVYKC